MVINGLPARLAEIVEDFGYCEGREKLEYLLEFSERLPALPERYVGRHDDSHQVHECMSPVWVYAEQGEDAGIIQFFFDVPPEAPTVRGFAGIMFEGVGHTTPQAIMAIPNDFYTQMGLQTVLTGQRLNGMSAILRRMKQLAQQTID